MAPRPSTLFGRSEFRPTCSIFSTGNSATGKLPSAANLQHAFVGDHQLLVLGGYKRSRKRTLSPAWGWKGMRDYSPLRSRCVRRHHDAWPAPASTEARALPSP